MAFIKSIIAVVLVIATFLGCNGFHSNHSDASKANWAFEKSAIFSAYVDAINLRPTPLELKQLVQWRDQTEISPATFRSILLQINSARLSQIERDEEVFNLAERAILEFRPQFKNDDFIPMTFGVPRGTHFAIIEGSLKDQRTALEKCVSSFSVK